MIDGFNFTIEDFCIFCIVITLCVCLVVAANNFSKNEQEEDCFTFYKENGYILDACKEYEEKLNNFFE